MITLLIKYAKKVLTLILISWLFVSFTVGEVFCDYTENTIRKVDVVVRVGEYGNDEFTKPGKRYNWGPDINISQHGISVKDIPTDIPLRCENNNFFISEFDINLKTARVLAKKLDSLGIDVDLQYSSDSSTDLNQAGVIASQKNPKIYLSIHHNSFKENSEGYFFMYNENDVESANMSYRLNESINKNGFVKPNSNRPNTKGYIGELNKVAKEGRISILAELGYFSNPNELLMIMSDEYIDYITTEMADEIYNQFQNTNVKGEDINSEQKTIGIKNKSKENKSVDEITIKFTDGIEDFIEKSPDDLYNEVYKSEMDKLLKEIS